MDVFFTKEGDDASYQNSCMSRMYFSKWISFSIYNFTVIISTILPFLTYNIRKRNEMGKIQHAMSSDSVHFVVELSFSKWIKLTESEREKE